MRSATQRIGRRKQRVLKPGAAGFRFSLTALVTTLSFVFQILAIPYHQALVASAMAAPDAAQIAAELKATFGDAAALCVQTDDEGAPAAPAGDCGDHCPLCQFAAQATALIAPDAPALHAPISVGSETIGIAPTAGAVPVWSTAQNRARAPPFPV